MDELFPKELKSTTELPSWVIFEIRPDDYFFWEDELVEKVNIFEWVDKRDYLPSPERQSWRYFDTYWCVSYAFLNSVEMIFKRQIALWMISKDNLDWLEEEGYLINWEVNFSDRWLVLRSNTTPRAWNSWGIVAQTARTLWLASQKICDWNLDSWTEEEYYDKSTISKKADEQAAEFAKRFDIHYNWVLPKEREEAEKYSALEVFTYAWFKCPNSTIYYNPKRWTSNHAVMLINSKEITLFDTYQPYIKTMSSMADFLDFSLAIYVTEKTKKMWNVKIIKDQNSKTVGIWLPIENEEAFTSYCNNYWISVKTKEDNKIDWKAMIDGTLKLS